MEYIQDKEFEKTDFTVTALSKGEYENCTFIGCDFSNSSLTDVKFIECKFEDCNLSMATISNTAFQNILFKNCKMLGLHFENCTKFGLSFSFEGCNLSHCSFYQLKLKKTIVKDSKLHEVDLTGCDLSQSVFDNCDFNRAAFHNTNLEKADLRMSFNYSIDPTVNQIKKARFSLVGLPGLLEQYDIQIEQ